MDFAHIIRQIAITAVPILIAIILHEVAHGFVAYKLGDPTAKMLGRLTLNPIAHIDMFGTIIMPLLLFVVTNGQFVFGYAKPVPINPHNFKNPRRDMAISAAGGPATNILLAILSVLVLKYAMIPASAFVSEDIVVKVIKPLVMMLTASVTINVILASFNLMPILPLDGGRVLMGFLPERQANAIGRLEPFGMIIILILVMTGMAGYIIMPLVKLFLGLIDMI
ncbi:site-2 protease family protein [Dissulfurispira thermophila]|uniref:Site-2 protease family protein n=1 Tax=Dissulfurispira thermophila TaxID=2715679 RepID=A0A7G1H5G6_9BACT|nr:site-2 protease family protein [Dissulfurispira thermophila]BCB97332.1 site-2 protease family protein [Dissulfurispira thermophila]